jgi:hypothetical protein
VTEYGINSLLILKISLGLKVNSDADFDDSPSCLISVICVNCYQQLCYADFGNVFLFDLCKHASYQFDQNKTP